MTITEEDIDKALAYLRDTAAGTAQARANRLYMEQWIKTVKAEQVVKAMAAGNGAAASEAIAMDTHEYRECLNGYREAVELDEKNRFLREAATTKIMAWQTMSANERAGQV
jgi:hypothetical protein